MKRYISLLVAVWYLLFANTTFAFTHADTLRGSNGRGRAWWDVQKYNLIVRFDTAKRSIQGSSHIYSSIVGEVCDSMQIDLQEPMIVDSASFGYYGSSTTLKVAKEGNVWWLIGPFRSFIKNKEININIYYHGIPKQAVNPPWDGGFSWKTDSAGKPWIAVSCQGLGASVWWPCKDAQWDEPDKGMDIIYRVPKGLVAVGNGRLLDSARSNNMTSWLWQVKNPINNYDVSFYIGDYVHWHDTMAGEKGTLDLDYWVLRQSEAKARKQFAVVKQMLHCFEYWMGPYPFYEDGYKLVEAPYLGMEHQSAVAYGNDYKMGYKGYDRTFTGVGMKFDYIIIHETGHEWFGNSVTAADMADNWIHEGITTYSETLFAECQQGKEKSEKYCRGEWMNIRNDKPMIGPYGVNEEGSGDIYDKGTAIMYMIRKLTNDDEKFRQMLRGLGSEFYHQQVTTKQVEEYIAAHTGLELKAFFDQYLRTADVPLLEYSIRHKKLSYRFSNTIAGFTVPVTVAAGDNTLTLKPTSEWQTVKWKKGYNVKWGKDFLIKVK